MPIQDGVLIACKNGVVELTSTITEPQRDEPESFVRAVALRVYEHQLQVMTDPTILDPDNLRVASVVESRDPLGPALHQALASVGFEALDTEGGAVEERSLFSRLSGKRRSKLDKWRTMFLRASDVSPKLAELEGALVDALPDGALPQIAETCAEVLVETVADVLGLRLSSDHEGLGQLERTLLQLRARTPGRLVLHPLAVRAIAAFTGESVRAKASDTAWSEDPEDSSPLWVAAPRGTIVRTDPEYRVAAFVARGSKEMLTSYVESVLRQSLTAASQS
ncbi:hypothetical protein L6R52_06290 [Myxococcota bacterium]|nr:hypothetical protein [Myxococcota bacterium]